ncbi:MAG: LVIVD repeat-containing protein [Bacteroidales bacterium]
MKTKSVFYILMPVFLLIFAYSCQDDDKYTYDVLSPVYMQFAEFRTPLKSLSARNIKQAGKIYFKDSYIFLNEVNEGIHVIDNSDPRNPVKIAFYEITGNVDLAIRGNTLFADSYIDLVAIDISNIRNPVEVGRIENAFPEVLPIPDDPSIPMAWDEIDRSLGVIVDWKTTTRTGYGPEKSFWRGNMRNDLMTFSGAMESAGAGVAGSMARFMLNQEYLHSIAQPFVLKTIDVSSPENMVQTDSIHTWREMETLFRYDSNLFVGTTTGMVIYSLENPVKPEFISELNHINACDPVVVENGFAYVTLRAGTRCMNSTNQLDVIDISDITRPKLLKSYPMFNPHGLGIDNGTLFICDGADGLKVYDATNPLAVQSNMIAHFDKIDTFDVIPLGEILLLIGQDGLFQYDYSDPANISLLSHIKVGE